MTALWMDEDEHLGQLTFRIRCQQVAVHNRTK